MPQIINTNIASLTAQRNLNRTQNEMSTALTRLSSGLRINSAKDDAAGLGIAERMSSQVRGLNQSIRNANDAVSLSQTAEGALSTASGILQRIRELAVQSANATNSDSDRLTLNSEVSQLVSELDRVAQTTEFNGTKLLDGTFGTAAFQVGANEGQTIIASTGNFRTNQYGNYRVTGTAASASTAAASGSETSRAATAQALTINGSLGTATVTPVTNSSAKAVAEQVNAQTNNTGVTATAETSIDLSVAATGAYQLSIVSDNTTAQSISFNVTATSGASGLSSAIKAFNDASSKTGVTAELNSAGTGITLTNSTGNDIIVRDGTTANAGAVTVGTATLAADSVANGTLVTGQVLFNSDKSFSVNEATGGHFASVSNTSALQAVSTLDVSTLTNANAALSIVDSAITNIVAQRASFGALQNRLESTISNLSVTSENLAAARSRIQDADFASETAAMTRAQILQQAGVSIVQQANSLPQLALSLLR
ncbi:MAG: flagellin [Gammaproteobacteria bacterium]|nr:flagellin [Gammaproteobacteria bacterium]